MPAEEETVAGGAGRGGLTEAGVAVCAVATFVVTGSCLTTGLVSTVTDAVLAGNELEFAACVGAVWAGVEG